MEFPLAVLLVLAFVSINGLTEIEEKRLNDIINLIWPPEEINKIDGPVITNMIGTTATETCKCVSYRFCKNVTSCVNDCNYIDLKNVNNSCVDYLKTCCEDANILTAPVTIALDAGKPTGCGVRNEYGYGHRIKGNTHNETQFAEFPWMVAILLLQQNQGVVGDLDSSNLLVYQCGGSLIHPQVVLTATHCVLLEDAKYVVRAGEWDTQSKDEFLPFQDRMVANITTHPEYNSGSLHNDIALLFLEKPFDITGNVDTVCLPPVFAVVENTRCFATGWGKDSYGMQGQYQIILKKLNLPVVERNLCQEQLRKTHFSERFTLHESFVCAGGERGVDTCTGDGGSPLVCPIPGYPKKYYQGGIVVTGVGCGLENVPGLYTNVPLFRNWVDEQMIKSGYSTLFYTY